MKSNQIKYSSDRRDFLAKCGVGLAGILLARQSPAIITRSLLGANGIEYVPAGGDDFPYVRNGLIAMWDAEWNAGVGVHNPEATLWKDLAGEYNLTVSSGRTFESNYFNVNGYSASRTGMIPGTSIATVESVFYCNVSKGGSMLPRVLVALRKQDGRVHKGIGIRSGLIQVGYNQHFNFDDTIVSSVSIGYGNYASSSNWVYQNKNNLTPNSYTYAYGYNYPNNFVIGCNDTAGQCPFIGRLYCLRIYDRLLNNTERIRNYGVDTERFGL